MRYWQPEDIYTLPCPFCGEEIEFWKDEPFRPCRGCGKIIRNIRIDLGCAKWCKHAAECLGAVPETTEATAMFDRLMVALEQLHSGQMEYLRQSCRIHACAMQLLPGRKECDPMVIQAAALLCGELLAQFGGLPQPKEKIATEKESYLSLLQKAGIDPRSAENIWELVKAILCEREVAIPEFALIHEAVHRVMTAVENPA